MTLLKSKAISNKYFIPSSYPLRIEGMFVTMILATLYSASALSITRTTRTKLSYSNDGEIIGNMKPLVQRESKMSSVWSNVFTQRINSDQENVDEYLEFLDRRYHRLREDDDEATAFSSRFSWNWLFDNDNKEHPDSHQNQGNNSLYALGVAELASEKLLQKHQISVGAARRKTTTTPSAIGGLFGRPQLSTVRPALNDKIKKHVTVPMKIISKLPKKMLIALSNNKVASTVLWSTALFLCIRLTIGIAPVLRKA